MDAMAAGQLKHQTNIHDLHEAHYNQRQTTRHPGIRQGRSRKECWYTCEWLEHLPAFSALCPRGGVILHGDTHQRRPDAR
jgi:hypothetical protein